MYAIYYVYIHSAQYIRRQYTILLKIQNEKSSRYTLEKKFKTTSKCGECRYSHVPNQIIQTLRIFQPLARFDSKNCGRKKKKKKKCCYPKLRSDIFPLPYSFTFKHHRNHNKTSKKEKEKRAPGEDAGNGFRYDLLDCNSLYVFWWQQHTYIRVYDSPSLTKSYAISYTYFELYYTGCMEMEYRV